MDSPYLQITFLFASHSECEDIREQFLRMVLPKTPHKFALSSDSHVIFLLFLLCPQSKFLLSSSEGSLDCHGGMVVLLRQYSLLDTP